LLVGKISGEQTCNQVSTNEKIRDSLYLAARKGDWRSANDIYKKYPNAAIWYLPITQQKMNVLQVAVAAKQTDFVKQLLNCMEAKELEFENANGDTALLITALSGNVKIAKKMVGKNKNLPGIRNKEEHLPLLTAAMHRHKDVVLYLYHVTDFEELTPEERIKLFLYLIFYDSYGMSYTSLNVGFRQLMH
jgi:ankyrin repeat protein